MKLKADSIRTVEINLLTEKNPETIEKLGENLPLKGNAKTWGKEIYFSVGITINAENTQTTVEEGAVAFWPSGNAICVFFGPTPASTDNQPKAAGPVNVFGTISESETKKFEQVSSGETIRVIE